MALKPSDLTSCFRIPQRNGHILGQYSKSLPQLSIATTVTPDEPRESTRVTQTNPVADQEATPDILRSNISEYERAIENLPQARNINCEQEVMAVLVARDEVARALAKSQ